MDSEAGPLMAGERLRRCCNGCAKTKHRCSGETPKCIRCARNNKECVYLPRVRPGRRPKTSTVSATPVRNVPIAARSRPICAGPASPGSADQLRGSANEVEAFQEDDTIVNNYQYDAFAPELEPQRTINRLPSATASSAEGATIQNHHNFYPEQGESILDMPLQTDTSIDPDILTELNCPITASNFATLGSGEMNAHSELATENQTGSGYPSPKGSYASSADLVRLHRCQCHQLLAHLYLHRGVCRGNAIVPANHVHEAAQLLKCFKATYMECENCRNDELIKVAWGTMADEILSIYGNIFDGVGENSIQGNQLTYLTMPHAAI